jgi:hypothetical protein
MRMDGGSGSMSRLVKLLLALVVVVLALFFLAGIDSEKPVKPIERPIEVDAPAQ